MKRPPTLADAEARGLLAKKGIHTFSNGTEWEYWASGNCLSCWFYRLDGDAGEFCAFEAAALLDTVSPELATLFGWKRHEQYADSWVSPDECTFFKERPDGDDDSPPPPPVDPLQLNLLADPTEDAALIVAVDSPELAEVNA